MAPPDQGGGASPRSPALRRQKSCTCSHSRDEPAQLERRLSCSSASFQSPATSYASTTYDSAAPSNQSSCESISFADLGKPSSFSSSTSSYESFFRSDPDHDGSKYLDFEPPPTRAPAVQAMAAAYDSKRLPSSMFRTLSTNPAEWSVTSNESLFSIRLSNSGDIGDLYYDAAGFPRFPSMGRDASLRLSSFGSEVTGGLCQRGDCARCSSSGATTRKSVRFASMESVSGGSNHSAIGSPANTNAQEPTTASMAKTPETTTAGWCQIGCYWPSLPTTWWPCCCAWQCYCCD